MASASSPKSSCDDCGYNEGPKVARLDNSRIEESSCDDFYTPTLDFDDGCDHATVQLQSKGQGYLRAKDDLRAALGVEAPLGVSDDGKKVQLSTLPWPAVRDDEGNIGPADSLSAEDCDDLGIGYWSDRPGEHPFIDTGRNAWPVDCAGEPVAEAPYDPGVGTFKSRDGHPIINSPEIDADCVYSQIWSFSTASSGTLPVSPSNPVEIPFINQNCCCGLVVKLDMLFTYTINNLITPGSTSGINLAFKGHASSPLIPARSWTFRQGEIGDESNIIFTGNSSAVVKIDPKGSTTVRIWPEIALGTAENFQPSQFNINSCVEVCYTASLAC